MISRADVKRIARHVVSSLTYFSGYCALAERLGAGRGVRILCYHSIVPQPVTPFAVSVRDFCRQMELLVRDFHLLSMDEAVSLLRAEETLPSRAIAVTIDDGYENAHTYAYPILREFGVPATVFLPTAFIGIDLASGKRPHWAQGRFLSWDQVREMHRGGIDFGSHTVDHPSLSSLPSQQIGIQLRQSKRRIEEEIGAPVTGLSYPYGLPEDVRGMAPLAADAGYSWAVTGIHGVNAGPEGLLALRRIKVERDDGLYVFTKAAVGAMDPWAVVDRLGAMGMRSRH